MKPFEWKAVVVSTELADDVMYDQLLFVDSVWRTMQNVVVKPTVVRSLSQQYVKPKVFLDLEGKVRIDHNWFYTNITQRYVTEGYNLIIYHMSKEQRDALGLDPNVNGTYWRDRNNYMECWIAGRTGELPGRDRTRKVDGKDISEFVRLMLHEGGHAALHFSGRNEELTTKYGGDPVHYMDYGDRNVAKIYSEVSFEKWSLQAYILALATQLLALVKKSKETKPNYSKLTKWAEAIKEFEGWAAPGDKIRGTGGVSFRGSRSYRQNNPGNLRWSIYEADNVDNFSVFKTYEDGWKALLHQLTIAATGKSSVYRPTMTLLEFFQKYAPSEDNNHPETYAKYVANYIGVTPQTLIKDLI